jgi:hypothetical protein
MTANNRKSSTALTWVSGSRRASPVTLSCARIVLKTYGELHARKQLTHVIREDQHQWFVQVPTSQAYYSCLFWRIVVDLQYCLNIFRLQYSSVLLINAVIESSRVLMDPWSNHRKISGTFFLLRRQHTWLVVLRSHVLWLSWATSQHVRIKHKYPDSYSDL